MLSRIKPILGEQVFANSEVVRTVASIGDNHCSVAPTASPSDSPVANTVEPTSNPSKEPAGKPSPAPVEILVSTNEPTNEPTQKPDGCFSGSTTVDVRGKGAIRMDELSIGDFVKTDSSSANTYSRVFSFGHRHVDAEMDYLQIRTQGLKSPLEISTKHMLLVNETWQRAESVKVSDMLGAHNVSHIVQLKRRGLYAPTTESGNIVVSGLQCSSYVALLHIPPGLQRIATHAMMAPLRMVCSVDFGICENETYDDATGFSHWTFWVVKMALWLMEYHPIIQLSVVLAVAPCPFAFYFVEQLFLFPGVAYIAIRVGVWCKLSRVVARKNKSL